MAVVGYLGLMSMTVFLIDETRTSTLLDEYFVVAMLPLAVIGSGRFYRVLPRSMGLILIYLYWVFVSAIIAMLGEYEGQIPLLAPVIGVILDLKIFVVLFALVALSHRLGVNPDETILGLCKAIVIITFLYVPFVARDIVSSGDSLAGVALQENPLWGYIPHGLFSHKFEVALLSGLAIAASLTLYIHRQQAIIYLLYSIVFFVMLSFSSSLKEFVAIMAMVPVLVIFQLGTGRGGESRAVAKKGVRLVCLLGGIALATFLLWEYVGGLLEARSIYLTEETVRGRMYTASIEIAFDMFPFGSGAGTFGSYPSMNIYYSPLYSNYGLSTLYGASGEGPGFLMDAWWPKVFGEGGVIGGGAYLAIVGTAFLGLARKFLRAPSPANTFGLFLGILVLFASIASSPFNSSLGMLIGALFILMFYLESRSRLTQGV